MVAYNAADPPLPVPPIPVMPPEGGGPLQRQPTPGEQAELSPTAMIQNYLSQRGYQPTGENVRRALEANARDPGVIGGLRSDTAGVDPAAGVGGGSAGLPTPPIPPTLERPNAPMGMQPAPAPAADTGIGGGMLATLGALIAAASGGRGGLKYLTDRLGGGAPTPAPAPAPPPDTVGAAAKPDPKVTSAPPQTPQEAALSKATDGAPLKGVDPVDPAKVTGRSVGPTTATAGAEVPQMPPLKGAQPPPAQPPVTEPGVARTQSFRPRSRGPRIPLPRL